MWKANRMPRKELPPTFFDSLAVLGSRTRCLLLFSLVRGPRNVSCLATEVGVGLQDASYHLRFLARRSFVVCDRLGRQHVFRLAESIVPLVERGMLRLRWQCRGGGAFDIQHPASSVRA